MEIRGRLFLGNRDNGPAGEEIRVYDTYHLEPIARALTDGWGVWTCAIPDDTRGPIMAVVRQGRRVPYWLERKLEMLSVLQRAS